MEWISKRYIYLKCLMNSVNNGMNIFQRISSMFNVFSLKRYKEEWSYFLSTWKESTEGRSKQNDVANKY